MNLFLKLPKISFRAAIFFVVLTAVLQTYIYLFLRILNQSSHPMFIFHASILSCVDRVIATSYMQ